MNADRLLALYARIADAPDAVARLRRFILDLAVRGKLVPQDPADEPASELLKRIAKEKARLVKEGDIGREKPLPSTSESDVVFAVPRSWAVVRLGTLARLVTSGSRDWAKFYANEGALFVRMGNLSKDHYRLRLDNVQHVKPPSEGEGTRTRLEAGDILISITGDVGMLGLIPENFGEAYINQHIALVRPMPVMKGTFLAEVFRSPFAQNQFNEPQRGIKNSFRLTDVSHVVVPLPPLAEQQRIVAKVDELMGLCDRLEEARTRREAHRERLTTASLSRLTAPDTDAETFQSHARFALEALPALTSRPDQIKALRQTILSLAVRGKLVAQEQADGSAVRFDKLWREDEVGPFPIPPNWSWSRLRALGEMKGGGTPSKDREEYWGGDIPWVSPKDMKRDYISDAKLRITPEAITGSSVKIIPRRSIIFVVRGMILAHSFPVALTLEEVAVNQDMKALTLTRPEMAEFLLRVLKGLKPEMLQRVQRSSHGTCRLEGADYAEFPIPLPPLAEQHRIVAKVDQLMALCDQLEAALTTADTTRRRLLEALLHEALAPAADTLAAAQ